MVEPVLAGEAGRYATLVARSTVSWYSLRTGLSPRPAKTNTAASATIAMAAKRAVFTVSGRFTIRATRCWMDFFPPVMAVEQDSKSAVRRDRAATMSTRVRP